MMKNSKDIVYLIIIAIIFIVAIYGFHYEVKVFQKSPYVKAAQDACIHDRNFHDKTGTTFAITNNKKIKHTLSVCSFCGKEIDKSD